MLFGHATNAVIISPDKKAQEALGTLLVGCGLAPIPTSTVQEAKTILDQDSISVVLSSDELPDGKISDILERTTGGPNAVLVVVFSRLADWKYYLKVVRDGAFDCLAYPPERGELERVVRNAVNSARRQEAKAKAAAG
jgi:DNA-binding NtrC family response regulator